MWLLSEMSGRSDIDGAIHPDAEPPRGGDVTSAYRRDMDAGVVDEHVRRRPAEALRPYIAWYSGYRQRGVAPALHRGLPSPFLTLIFTLDEPLTMLAHPDPAQPPGDFGSLLGGLHASPALIAHQGAQSGIQIALKPLGTRALLGLPAGELAQVDLPTDAVLGGIAGRIHDRVRAADGWPARFAVLDEDFAALLGAHRAGMPRAATGIPREVIWAWRLLLRSGGRLPVARLAAETGWSTRHLAGRFRTEIGLTPKAAGRVIRFDRARRRLVDAATARSATTGSATTGSATTGLGLADLAVSCGYFDQAHLAREFRALSGCPPSQWLAEEFRNVQAGAWLAEEGW
jgi:AraC-like DNA-binding protein